MLSFFHPLIVMTCAHPQKVDLFSLGIILFEMSYRPMTTGSERITVLGQLREVGPSSALNSIQFNSMQFHFLGRVPSGKLAF